jgi:hypothetical protein
LLLPNKSAARPPENPEGNAVPPSAAILQADRKTYLEALLGLLVAFSLLGKKLHQELLS